MKATEKSPCAKAGHEPGSDAACPRCAQIRRLAERAAQGRDLSSGDRVRDGARTGASVAEVHAAERRTAGVQRVVAHARRCAP